MFFSFFLLSSPSLSLHLTLASSLSLFSLDDEPAVVLAVPTELYCSPREDCDGLAVVRNLSLSLSLSSVSLSLSLAAVER